MRPPPTADEARGSILRVWGAFARRNGIDPLDLDSPEYRSFIAGAGYGYVRRMREVEPAMPLEQLRLCAALADEVARLGLK